jgi:hypothetical protein
MKSIKFNRSCAPYSSGEIAGFDAVKAKKLVDTGAAEYVVKDRPAPKKVAPEPKKAAPTPEKKEEASTEKKEEASPKKLTRRSFENRQVTSEKTD